MFSSTSSRKLTTIELLLTEIQSFLSCGKELSETPKLAIVFPVVSNQFINTVENIVTDKYKSLVTVVVSSSMQNVDRRLILVTSKLIKEKVLKDCYEAENQTSSLTYCEKKDCNDDSVVIELNESGARGTNKAVDAHLHCIQYGTNSVIRQPLSDSYWQQLGKSQLIEITEIAGPVTLLKPDWNTTVYNEAVSDFFCGHLIEIYGFPSSWSTTELRSSFCSVINHDEYKIERCDSTNALFVFKDDVDASSALTVVHPCFKSRPAVLCSETSRQYIQKNSEMCLPFKKRPKKDVDVAKRLIRKSLGISDNCSGSCS